MTNAISEENLVVKRLLEMLTQSIKILTETKWAYIAVHGDGTVAVFDQLPTADFAIWTPQDGSNYMEVGYIDLKQNGFDSQINWRDLLVNLAPTTPSPSKTYIVVGECGNRELKEKWNVIAYSDKKNAVTHCLKVQAASDRYYEMNEGELYYSPNVVNIEGDPNMRVNVITRTSYHVEEVMLGDHYGI